MPPEPDPTPTPTQGTLERMRLLRQKAELTLAKNPDEPDGLLAQQQYLKLLARYRLDPSTLEHDINHTGEVTATRYTFPGGAWLAKREHLLNCVCSLFKVPHLLLKADDGTAAALLTGNPHTLDAVLGVCDYLMPQLDLMVLRAKTAPGYQEETPAGRRIYVSGALDAWVEEVYGRLAALYREAEHESDTAAMSQELARYDQAQQVMQDLMDQMQQAQATPRRAAVAVPGYHHEDARELGRAQGATADLGQTATGSGGAGPLAVGT